MCLGDVPIKFQSVLLQLSYQQRKLSAVWLSLSLCSFVCLFVWFVFVCSLVCLFVSSFVRMFVSSFVCLSGCSFLFVCLIV